MRNFRAPPSTRLPLYHGRTDLILAKAVPLPLPVSSSPLLASNRQANQSGSSPRLPAHRKKALKTLRARPDSPADVARLQRASVPPRLPSCAARPNLSANKKNELAGALADVACLPGSGTHTGRISGWRVFHLTDLGGRPRPPLAVRCAERSSCFTLLGDVVAGVLSRNADLGETLQNLKGHERLCSANEIKTWISAPRLLASFLFVRRPTNSRLALDPTSGEQRPRLHRQYPLTFQIDRAGKSI